MFKTNSMVRDYKNLEIIDGAPARIRTADLLITNQLLYQLSYKGIRINKVFNVKSLINQQLKDMVIEV